jgi:hypothetical protein
MDNDNIEEMMNRIVADTIREILTNRPTDIESSRGSTTEKKMAWIELHEDVLEEAYDMSKEYREYE